MIFFRNKTIKILKIFLKYIFRTMKKNIFKKLIRRINKFQKGKKNKNLKKIQKMKYSYKILNVNQMLIIKGLNLILIVNKYLQMLINK